MDWNKIASKVKPYVVKIETPSGSGTGFLCMYNDAKTLCGIATAHHVIEDAEKWQQPIRIQIIGDENHHTLLKESDRFILLDWKTDSAVIIFHKTKLPLPSNPIKLLPLDRTINIGDEVGWLGFPSIDSYTLCFFSGIISARREDRSAYLIDGVAISGVSGGPVFYATESARVQIVGIITAYQFQRLRGDALPGLSMAQDVSHFHQVINDIRSLEESSKAKQKIEKPQKKITKNKPPRKNHG